MEALQKAVASHDRARQGKIVACETVRHDKEVDLDRLVNEISSKEEHTNLLITAAGIPGPKAEPDQEETSSLKAKLWYKESFEQ
jgi:hypothetical protein